MELYLQRSYFFLQFIYRAALTEALRMQKKIISPKKKLLAVRSVLATAVLALLTSISSNWLGTEWVEEYLPEIAIGIVICILVLISDYIHEKSELTKVIAQEDSDSRKQLIQNLRELYRNRLADKMKGDLGIDINLKLKYSITGTSPERVKFYKFKEEALTGDFESLFEDYIKEIKRLLILGEPGAGKSVLMLRFASKMSEIAEKDENFPVPVVLDLATWKRDDQTFEHWLEQNLPYIAGSFAISKKEARRLVESNALLLLLDGFDEIQEQYRNSCFEKLQFYLRKLKHLRNETLPEVIICSRISEYLRADDAPVFATIEIQPFQPRDIQTILQSMGAKNDETAIELQLDLEKNANLYTAITSAFFLHILLNIYSQENNLHFSSDSKELLQKEITEVYIQNELVKLKDYPVDKVKKWLGWLAWKMKNTSGIVTFELTDLQPNWSKKIFHYNLTISIIGGFFIGLTSAAFMLAFLIFTDGSKITINNISDIPVVLITVLVFGLLFSLVAILSLSLSRIYIAYDNKNKDEIVTKEIQEVNLKNFNLKKCKEVLIKCEINSLVYGLPFVFLLTIFFTLFDPNRWDPASWDAASVVDILVISLLISLIFGLLLGLPNAIISAFSSEKSLPKINSPYKRLFAQLWGSILKMTMVSIIAFGIINKGDINHYDSVIYLGLIFGLWLSIISSSIFKHFCLRISLFLETVIPLKLVKFLNSVSNNSGLLIRHGGQWRFRHQLILDSLANSFEETCSDILKKRK
ncbi:MAG: NACHT domain-containing protein [Flavobacterium sp.]|nr:NACHT domain-containing protein [Flavobacterium sp.]